MKTLHHSSIVSHSPARRVPLAFLGWIGRSLSLAALGLLINVSTPKASADNSPPPAETASVWQTIDNASVTFVGSKEPVTGSYQVLRLNKNSLAQQLARAPMERSGDLKSSPAVLSLPMPDGSFQRFRIEESPSIDAELVAKYPKIKSYRGQGIDDGTATVRFDWTPLGFHALILSADHAAVNILPPDQRDLATYASYYDEGIPFHCGVNEVRSATNRIAPHVANGATLRTERFAIAATWEFCNTIGGDTVAGTVAAINAYLNATNAIYERELAIHMNLVNAPNVIYASNNNVCGPGNNAACNAGNDPFTNDNEGTMLDEVQPDLRDKVGTANYDLGHVLGTGGAGIAGLGVVCEEGGTNGPRKGAGSSRIFGPPGNASAVSLFAHEVGHQHGASHSFNGTNSFCGPSRSEDTAWEPGSGSTLMAYGGICTSDNLANSKDDRFHNGSYNQIQTYLAASGGCAVMTPTGNSIPTVDGGAARTIPKMTPFTLTATGADADQADVPNLRYVWEELDAGGTAFPNPPYGDQAGDPATTTRPLFRAFPQTADNSRTFPSLTYILNNANIPPATVDGLQTAESLPAVSRTMNFRATIRDQRGGVNDSAVAVTVDGNSGPFAVTFPNGGQTIGGMQNVTWSVNGTNAAPVNVANVKISLSTDGGNTFPTVLAASTPNTGSATVALPNGILNSTARIKVEAVGNIFFDISDANFSLTPGDGCLAVSSFTPQLGQTGTVVTIAGVNLTGVTSVTFNGTAATNFTVNSDTQITATVPAGATGGALVLSKPGCTDLIVGSFSICPNAPAALSIDDGSIESASGAGANAYFVNRLTPAAYPASVSQVAVYFDAFQQFPAGSAIKIVAAANPGGTANIDNLTFQTVPAVVGTLGMFTTVNLPTAVTINSGDFVVGFQVVGNPGGFPAPVDLSSSQNRSYNGDGTSFTVRPTGNLMIRASQVSTGCSAGPATVQFAAASARVNENAGTIDLTVERTGDTSGTTMVNFSTGGGTATPGQDFTPESGQLTFGPTQTMKTISVPIIDDPSPEPDETFNVTLSMPAANGSLHSGTPEVPEVAITQETVTIVDNDGAIPMPSQVVSRKMHAGIARDLVLPLTGPVGVECRSGGVSGNHQIVFTFASPVTFSSASIAGGTGSVSSSSGSGTTTVTVNLTGIADVQRITLSLLGLSDGTNTGDLGVPIGFLVGDINGNGAVSASDIGQVKAQSGQTTDGSNFRSDINVSGAVNASDVGLVKARSGIVLPP